MENNILKNLFIQKRYNEVVEMLESLYCDLYKEMLNYKNVSFNVEGYNQLGSLVRKNYPQFHEDLVHVQAIASDTNSTYLDYINILLSTYMHMKDEYKYYASMPYDENAEDENLEINDDFITFVDEDSDVGVSSAE